MPRSAPRACSQVGCRAYATRHGRCDAHQREERGSWQSDAERARYDADRGTAAQRGYDAAWRRVRDCVLAEQPLCVMCECEGRVTAATEVDHKTPVRQAPELRLVRSNLQPLCHPCHMGKTAQDRRAAR